MYLSKILDIRKKHFYNNAGEALAQVGQRVGISTLGDIPGLTGPGSENT